MKKTIYCTIIAGNYVPRALLLQNSIKKYKPDADFRILVVESPEEVERYRTLFPVVPLMAPDEIECPKWLHMAYYYDIMEFCTALKPFLMLKLCREGNVVYFDPDIEIFDSLAGIESAFEDADVLLTPHSSHPVPDDGQLPDMLGLLRCGQFNLGFIGISGNEEGLRLLKWWSDVLVEGALNDYSIGLFTDQFWANAFASFSSRLKIFRGSQLNLAYWNLFHYTFSLDENGHPCTEEGRVVFFHYSGLKRGVEERVSKYSTRLLAPKGSDLNLFLTDYLNRIEEQETRLGLKHKAYSFASYQDGTPITAMERRLFLAQDSKIREQNCDPFQSRKRNERLSRASGKGSQRTLLFDALIALDRLLAKARSEIFRIFRRGKHSSYLERTRLHSRKGG